MNNLYMKQLQFPTVSTSQLTARFVGLGTKPKPKPKLKKYMSHCPRLNGPSSCHCYYHCAVLSYFTHALPLALALTPSHLHTYVAQPATPRCA